MAKRYLRWVLGVEGRTLGYMIRKELQRDKMRERARKRAWGFKKKLKKSKGRELTRKYREEMRKREKKGKELEGRKGKRRRFFEERVVKLEEIERGREEGIDWMGDWITGENKTEGGKIEKNKRVKME